MEAVAILGVIGGAGGAWASWAKVINPIIKKNKAIKTKKEKDRDGKLDYVVEQLTFNGGSSVKDHIVNISKEVGEIKHRLDGIEENGKLSMTLQGIAFWVSDETGKCTYASPGICKVMGRSESEILGNNWMGWLHPEDKERIAAAWEFAITNKTAFDEVYSFKRSDGIWQKVWGTAFPKVTRNNVYGGVLGKLVPIEEAKKEVA